MTINGILDYVVSFVTGVEKLVGVKLDVANAIILVALVHALAAGVLFFASEDNSIRRSIRSVMRPAATQREARSAVRYITEHCERDNPDLALKCAQDYEELGTTSLMHVGGVKGALLDRLVVSHDPTTILELGAYFGYSAIRMARFLKKPGAKVYSMEVNKECADASRELVRFCGLDDRVEVFNEPAQEGIAHFRGRTGADRVDLVFIDHWKDLYVPDLKRLEASGLMRRGTVVVADNMIYPGVPGYLEYVSNNPMYETTVHPFKLPGSGKMKEDAIAVSIYQGTPE